MQQATGGNIWCQTHKIWGDHDPAELERIAAYVDTRGRFRPCTQCGLSPARHNGNLARVLDPAYAGHEYR